MRTIGDFVTANGFVDLVKARNRMAKSLGYVDYYDYKVTQAEGFGKAALFEILDTLEKGTRPLMQAARARLAKEKGEMALEPWNSAYMMAGDHQEARSVLFPASPSKRVLTTAPISFPTGDITKKLDPYFPFEKAIEQWGRSFSALGISYEGASMSLDLLDRKGKYSNGFCHWPRLSSVSVGGQRLAAEARLSSLATPDAVGSGARRVFLFFEFSWSFSFLFDPLAGES